MVVDRGTDDALAGRAVDVIDAWRADGVDPSDIAVLARVNSALLPVQVACLESDVPCTTPLTTQVLARTGIRTAFAYLRIGSDPGAIRREDVRDTIRRPSRGIAPMVVDMITRQRTTSVADLRRLASRLSGRDVPKILAYADDLEVVAEAVTPVDGRRTAGRSGRGSASTPPSTPWTPRGPVPTGPPTPTTWPRWSRWRRSTRTPPRSPTGCARS